jgi:hypothetical protein
VQNIGNYPQVLLTCLAILLLPPSSQSQPLSVLGSIATESPDPLALRRILIPPERVAAELAKAKPGLLIQIPREEFERYVKRAHQAEAAGKTPAQLQTASYRALLAGTSLRGTAQWTVANPAQGPRILPLEPLNLAIHCARWKDADASLGAMQGRSIALWVPQAGRHPLKLEWSARGEQTPDGIQFHLEVPPCPLTTFEFELPNNHKPVASRESILVTGPFPGPSGHRIWRLACAANTPVDLIVRRSGASVTTSPKILSRTQLTQTAAPEGSEATVDVDLELLHGSVHELIAECDSNFKPIRINARNAEIDTWDEALLNPFKSRLTIRLRGTFDGRFLQLRIFGRCAAPVDQQWTCSRLQIEEAVSIAESIVIQVPPGLRLENWNPGDFGLLSATTDSKGLQTLTLESGMVGAARALAGPMPPQAISADEHGVAAPMTGLRRPSARLRPDEGDLHVRQLNWWQVGSSGSSLTVQLDYEQVRGETFALRVAIPSNWRLDEIETLPSSAIHNWFTEPAPRGQTALMLELDSPLRSSAATTAAKNSEGNDVYSKLRLRMRLARQAGQGSPELEAPFPQVVASGARVVSGIFALCIDPQFRATVHTPLAANGPIDSWFNSERGAKSTSEEESAWDQRAPWTKQIADRLYRYADGLPVGTLIVHARRPRIRAKVTSDVVLLPGRAAVTTRLELKPELGRPNWVGLHVSSPVSEPWSWKSQTKGCDVQDVREIKVLRASPLLFALSGADPLNVAVCLARPTEPGSWWRLLLGAALEGPVTFETTLALADRTSAAPITSGLAALASGSYVESAYLLSLAGMDGRASAQEPGRWAVPLITLSEPDTAEGEIKIHATSPVPIEFEAVGLEAGDVDSNNSSNLCGAFRYRRPPISLEIVARMPVSSPLPQPHIDRVSLNSYVIGREGRFLHHFSFHVQNWTQRRLPVRLPEGVSFVAAQVDRRWLQATIAEDGIALTQTDGSVVVDLPVVEGGQPHRFDVIYSMPLPSWRLWIKARVPVPVLPIEPVAFIRTWWLPPDVLAIGGNLRPVAVSNLESASMAASGTHIVPAIEELGLESWSEWQPRLGAVDNETIVLTRHDWVVTLGWSALIISLLGAWRLRFRLPRERYGLLVLWLAITATVVVWLPEEWSGPERLQLAAGIGLASWWYVRNAIRSTMPMVSQAQSAIATMILATMISIAHPGRSEEPPARTVLLLPGPVNAPDQQTVLLSPDLLALLKDIDNRGSPDPILVSAQYSGIAKNSTAEFLADFRVHVLVDAPARVLLPLGPVELNEMLVDGKSAYPEPTAGSQTGYWLSVSGKGAHTFRARFTVPIASSGLRRELRFGIPELAIGQISFTAPASAKYLQSVQARGAQVVNDESRRPRLEADLGRTSSVQIRWFEQSSETERPLPTVRELYYWDIRGSATRLLAIYQYQTNPGALTSLDFNLPASMEARRVEATRLQLFGSAPRLAGWATREDSSSRRLHVEFQSPLTFPLQLFVELVPARRIGPRLDLTLPSLLDATSVEGFLAFRVDGRNATVQEHRRITGIEPDVFAADWQRAGVDDPGLPDRAYSFRRTSGAAPFLELEAKPGRLSAKCSQTIHWRLSEGNAALEASAKIVSPDEDLIYVNWFIPPDVHIIDVTGKGIRNWCRSASQLEIWLERGVREIDLGARALAEYQSGAKVSFSLPCMRFPAFPTQATIVNFQAESGVTLAAERVEGLREAALWSGPPRAKSDGGGGQGLIYMADRPFFGGVFSVVRHAQAPEAKASESIESKRELPPELPRPVRLAPKPGPAKLLFEDYTAAIPDGRSWLHRAEYWLYREMSTHVSVKLPDGASPVRIVLDAKEVPISASAGERHWLPDAGAGRLQAVSIYWKYSPEQEPLGQPCLDRPQIANVESVPNAQEAPVMWNVLVPPDCRLTGEPPIPDRQARARLELNRARAQLTLSRLLADKAAGTFKGALKQDLQFAQVRFYRKCHDADLIIGSAAGDDAVADLLQANRQLAVEKSFEEIRSEAERIVQSGGARHELAPSTDQPSIPGDLDDPSVWPGAPTYIRARAPGQKPEVRLVLTQDQQSRQLRGLSALIFIGALIAWMLTYHPQIVLWLNRLWPVTFVLAGCTVWLIAGPQWWAVVFSAIGIIAGLYYADQWRRVSWRRPRANLTSAQPESPAGG